MDSREEILALALRRAALRAAPPPPELAPLVALAAGYPDMGSFGAELCRRSPMPTGDPEAAFRAALQGCYGGQGAIDGESMVPLDRMPAWALEEAFGAVPESLDVFRAGYGGSIGPGRYVSTDPSHVRLFMRPGMRLLRMDGVPLSHLRAMGPGRIVGRLRGTGNEGVELVYWPPGTRARAAPAMTLGEFWGRYAAPRAGGGGSAKDPKPFAAATAESEVRAKLRAGQMAGVTYRSVFRPAGSNRAVVEIMGQRFTIDSSERLPLAGMRQVGGRGRSQLGPGRTQRDVNAFFGQYPRLGPEDFALGRGV
jgi:hypothetical protein